MLHVHSRYADRHTFLRPILDLFLFRAGLPSQVDPPHSDGDRDSRDGGEKAD